MKVCITETSLELFGNFFKRAIQAQLEKDQTYDMIVKELYKEALLAFNKDGNSEDSEVILQHLFVIPQLITAQFGSKPGSVTAEVMAAAGKDASFVYEQLQTPTLESIQGVVNHFAKLSNEQSVEVDAGVEPQWFDAISTTLFRLSFQGSLLNPQSGTYHDNIDDPAKVLENNVIRKVLNNQNDKGYKLQMMTLAQAKALGNVSDTTNYRDEQLPVMVLVNESGKVLRFDEQGTVTEDGGIPVFPIKTKAEQFNYNKELLIEQNMSIAGVTREAAVKMANDLIKSYLDNVSYGLSQIAAGTEVFADIDMAESQVGFLQLNTLNSTPLRDVTNLSELEFKVSVGAKQSKQLLVFAPNSSKPWSLDRGTLDSLSPEITEALLELMTNPYLKKDGSLISLTERSNMISMYIQQGDFGHVVFEKTDNKNSGAKYNAYAREWFKSATIGGIKYNIETPAEIEIFKQAFVDFTKAYKFKPHSPLAAISDTDHRLVSDMESVTKQGQIVKQEAGHVIGYKPDISFTLSEKAQLDDLIQVVMGVKDGELVMSNVMTRMSHITNHAMNNIVTNKNGEIRGAGSYIAFAPIKQKVVFDKTKLPPRRMSLEQRNRASAVQPFEETEADTWFKNHPMAGVLNLIVTDQLNSKGKGFLADFFMNTITLYKGSDKTSLYHEVYHAYFNGILSKAERDEVYGELRNQKGSFTTVVNGKAKTLNYSDATDLELEEFLAEEFRSYARNESKYNKQPESKIARFFKYLLELFNSFFGNRTHAEVRAYGLPELVETSFRNLYKGNIDASKFVTPMMSEALNQSVETGMDFTHQEVSIVMGSMNSMVSDYIQTVLNKSINADQISDLIWYRQIMVTTNVESEEYQTALGLYNESMGNSTTHGYGVFQLQDPELFGEMLMSHILPVFEYQLEVAKAELEEDPTSILAQNNADLLKKVWDNFGDATINPINHLGKTDSIIGLYLNNYAFIKPDASFGAALDVDTNDFNDAEAVEAFYKDNNNTSPFDLADEHTKILLSMIQGYTHNGMGTPIINRLGIPTLRNPKIIMGKILKLTANQITPEDILDALKTAALKDKEIAQLVAILGPLRATMEEGVDNSISVQITEHEQKQWSGFWGSINKPSVPLLQTTIERTKIKTFDEEGNEIESSEGTLELRSGRVGTQASQIIRTWGDNFNYNSTAQGAFYKTALDLRVLDMELLLSTYESLGFAPLDATNSFDMFHTTKQVGRKYRKSVRAAMAMPMYEADPFGFLEQLGMILPHTDEIREILMVGSAEYDIPGGLLNNLVEVLRNRPSGYSIESFDDLFKAYDYINSAGETVTVSPEGYKKEFAKISEYFDDSQVSSMARRADGETQSERPMHSSLTVAIATINSAKSYQELISTPGMEFWDISKNPIIGSSILTQMFRLDNPEFYGKRNQNIKLHLNLLSGSKLINGTAENGVSPIDSDNTTKFITDVYDTFSGHQEILRAADKSTSLTFYNTFIRKGSTKAEKGAIVPMEESQYMFGKNYKSTSLSFYNQFENHLEAELIRITRIKNLKKEIKDNPDKTYAFDKAFMDRGEGFNVFDVILQDDSLRDALTSLNLNENFIIGKILPKEVKAMIDKELRNYFIMRSSEILQDKGKLLPVIDSVKEKHGAKQSNEEFKKDLLDMFTVNNFIQNLNYAALFLGDSALYNVAGEDYHKRIAGMISTGTLFRFDNSWFDHVNTPEFGYDAFAKKHLSENMERIQERRPDYKKPVARTYIGYLNTAVIRESQHDSVYADHYMKMAGIDATEYKNMKESDGAGWITMDSYRTMAKSSNDWSQGQEDVFQAMLKGEEIDYDKAIATFPVRKYQYYGPVTTDNNRADAGKSPDLGMIAFHKYSLMPLIPLAIKGTKLEQLNEKLMEDGVDYVTMATGSKLSTVSKINSDNLNSAAVYDDLYSEDREILFDTDITNNKIHVRFLKRQVHIAEGFKGKINLPSQIRKMIYLGVSNNGVPIDSVADIDNIADNEWTNIKKSLKFNSRLSNWLAETEHTLAMYQKTLKEELLADIGMTEQISKDPAGNDVVSYSGNNDKLKEYIQNQLRSKELLPAEVEFIIDKNTGGLRSDLSTSLNAETIEKILVTMIDKKLRRIKVTGEGFIQAAGSMWERVDFKKPTAEDLETFGTNGLKTYHLIDKDGNIITDPARKGEAVRISKMEVKIAMQGSFKLLFDLDDHTGKKIKVMKTVTNSKGVTKNIIDMEASIANLNNALRNQEWRDKHEPLLTLAGPRIPTQAQNSLEAAVIAEFLPPSAGNIIILPSDIVAKTGADYDIDKLFLSYPNIVKIGKSIELQKHIPGITESDDALNTQIDNLYLEAAGIGTQIDAIYKKKQVKFNSLSVEKENIRELIADQFYIQSLDLDKIKQLQIKVTNIRMKEGMYETMPVSQMKDELQKTINQIDVLMEAQEEVEKNIKNYMIAAFGTDKYNELFIAENNQISELENQKQAVYNKLDSVKRALYGKSTKGLQNDILRLFAERITMPDNFGELVKANHTRNTKPVFAANSTPETVNDDIIFEELQDSNQMAYDKRNRGKKGTPAGIKTIASTTIFDYMYNLQKHEENTVGMESLGIAAVASTYHAVFTRMGAALEGVLPGENESIRKVVQDHLASMKDKSVKSNLEAFNSLTKNYNSRTLRFAHNKIIDETGIQISLGSIKSSDGKVISDLIGQLINGYVDVAKDAWIFNIQGNKENTPQLLFMIMTGVPIKSAIYFSSLPMIKEYNRMKKELVGVYAGLANGSGSVYTKSNAKKEVIRRLISKYQDAIPKELKGIDVAENHRALAALTEGEFDLASIKNMIKEKTPSYRQYEAFLHYLEIEEMADDISQFESVTKFDTAQTASLSDAQNRINTTAAYRDKTSKGRRSVVPSSWYKDYSTTSPGIMNNDDFTIKMFSQYFRLRNHPLVLKASAMKLLDKDKNEALGYDISTLRNDYKNDFLFYLYQNAVWSDSSYNGFTFKSDATLEDEVLIDEEGMVMYYNPEKLRHGRTQHNYEFSTAQKNSDPTNPTYFFPTEAMYLAYRLELGKARMMSEEELKEKYSYMVSEKLAGTTSGESLRRRIALYKSNNHIAFFNYRWGMAGILKGLERNNPELAGQYDLIDHIRADYDAKTKKSNLKLTQVKDADFSIVYRENLEALKSSKIPEIAEFFSKFEHMAIMQTGMNRRSTFDLTPIVDQEKLHSVIDSNYGIESIIQALDRDLNAVIKGKKKIAEVPYLGDFDTKFKEMVVSSYKQRVRGHNYVSDGSIKAATKQVSGKNDKVALISWSYVENEIGNNFEELSKVLDKSSMFTAKRINEAYLRKMQSLPQVYLVKEKIVAPTPALQEKLDTLLQLYFGIDNTGSIPTWNVVGAGQTKDNMSIADSKTLMERHGIKDEKMANISSKAIARSVSVKDSRLSSTQSYIDVINKKYPERLAGNVNSKFSSKDNVWIFGAGIFKNAYDGVLTEAEFTKKVKDEFDDYYVTEIEKALKAKVKVFNIGVASGIDQMAREHLKEKGFIEVYKYTAGGVYVTLSTPELASSDMYDVTAPEIVMSKYSGFGKFKSAIYNNKVMTTIAGTTSEKLLKNSPLPYVGPFVESFLNTLWNAPGQYQYEMGLLMAKPGRIVIGDSIIERFAEVYLMHKRKTYGKKAAPVGVGISSLSEGQRAALNKEKPNQQQSLNIYFSTKENADLSNFAERPITLNGQTFRTPEGAFQAMKIFFTNAVLLGTPASKENLEILEKLKTATGAEAKSLGTKIKDLSTATWDRDSSGVMKNILTLSFEQNPQALAKLFATGNAVLTHTQDKGKWGTEFPKLLMEVRSELRSEESNPNDITQEDVDKTPNCEG
jgi:predicted NAD-dependent protein-ADP-ribosyltransferase YbiA (DUF1768 family)